MAGIVFIGIKNSGKTTLINKVFFQSHTKTVSTSSETKQVYNGISIYDTPGLNGIEKSSIKHNTSTMYVIVVDTSQELLIQSAAILKKIKTLLGFVENEKVLLVATKCDEINAFTQKDLSVFMKLISKDFNVDVKLIVSSAIDKETEDHIIRNTILDIHLKKITAKVRKEIDKSSWSVSLFHNHNGRKAAVLAAIRNAKDYATVNAILLNQVNIFRNSAGLAVTKQAPAISNETLNKRWTQQSELKNKVTINNIYASSYYRRVNRAYQLTVPTVNNDSAGSPTSRKASPR